MYSFDEAAADRVEDFGRKFLTHRKGELSGQPLILADWQRAFIRPLFGEKREDGTRRYRSASIWVSRKAGKSTLAVLIALFMLFADGEHGAEVYCAAADKSQAAIVFDLAADMVRNSPALSKRAKVYRNSIVTNTGNVFRVLSSDAKTKHGFNASCIIYDEVHAWPDRDLYDVLHTSTGARKQPLEIIISTAGLYDKESLAWTLYDRAKRVRDGQLVDDSLLPVIYEADPDADFRDPAAWMAANPGLSDGHTIRREYIEAEAKRAEEEPSYELTFRRLHMGQWTSTVSKWIGQPEWEALARPVPDLSGRVAYGGLDMSTTTDISAFVLAFPATDTAPLYVLPFFWIPEGKLKKGRTDRVPYELWQRQGFLTVTPGDVVDYDKVRADIVALGEKYAIQEIRYDPWNSTQLATQLGEGDGFHMATLRQGFVSLSAPTKALEREIIGKTLAHNANPVLAWMVGNATLAHDAAGNVKVDKAKSKARVDGVAAMVSAMSGVMAARDNRSVYETRGLLTLAA